MKVGVLTFHLGPNYGGYWQALCLVEVIRRLGHDVEIINYKNRRHWESERFRPWVYRRPWKLWHDFRKHRCFNDGFKRLPLSPFTTDPTQVDWNAYDAIVVGSDIVWNCEYERLGRDSAYFGVFPVPYRGRLVAYAPSTGYMKPDYPAPPWVAEGLRRFQSIAVRDELTSQFVEHQVNGKPPLVADPTWLTDGQEASQPLFPRRQQNPFLLVYSFPLDPKVSHAVRDFAREKGLITIAVGYAQQWCDQNWGNVGPIEWVQLFRQAEYVVTGTFHGTLFSLRERAQFCVLRHYTIDAKVATPLALTGLEDRLASDPSAIARILACRIDYDQVDLRRACYAEQSTRILENALSS